MRAVVLSYSHHGFGMGRTAVQLGHELAGAFDPLESERTTMAETFGCPVYDTAAECLETAKPDLALVSGRHTLAPSYLQACVDAGVPCLFDKPWADCADRL
ncbi:MAG: Gfo/Idh/MocA family oxidoreductase, partial [Chloroflexota bacterium]|nr:Gfo/Idh/MocA family oxidoreductase [Chloroflexota bacterium]